MSKVWVIKDDGTRQCDERNKGMPLDVMQKELESLGAKVHSAEKRQDCIAHIRVCGAPTGQVNAYQISQEDWDEIKSSFVGPNGFREWTCDKRGDGGVISFSGEIPWPLIHEMQRQTAAFSNPVLVRELIGRESRYYEDGSPITKDFRPERVNIVTEKGSSVIKEIWFG